MPLTTLALDVRDRVATITIDRPRALNALDDRTVGELGEAIDEVRSRSDIAGALITGAGRKAFVAGADIAELATQTPLVAWERARRGQAVFSRIEQSPKPVIAAVNGYALGGGCELALACHLRVAAEGAKIGLPEVTLGIAPGYGGTQRLPRLVGKGRALELILTGDMIDAAEAYRIGLVNRVVPGDALMTAAEDLLRHILSRGPLAVALCLDAVNRGTDLPLPDGLALEANHFGLLAASEDMGEGMRAFLDKRPAHFAGR